jgi:hypothetical protein
VCTSPRHVAATRGKEYTTTRLCRSYREGGKVKDETVGNLSHLEAWMIDGLRDAGRPAAVNLDEGVEIVRSRPHGHMAAVLRVTSPTELQRVRFEHVGTKPGR